MKAPFCITGIKTAPVRESDEEILERIERQLEERQQEYDAEGFICGCETPERSR